MISDETIEYILSQVPQDFYGKENWLGVKMTPHTPMTFINKITATHVRTNEGDYAWEDVPEPVINTIYQRLKWNERLRSGSKEAEDNL